jgi:sugar phosphate isomerase/epimerase
MKKKIKVIAICLLLVTTILSVASIESEPKGNSVFDNGICKEGENTSNCLEGCIVTGFKGNNFGGDLLWYGVHPWKTNNETLNGFQTIFEDVGMEIARFDIYWGKLEPEKGVYNWTLTDTLLSTVDEDIPILLTVFCTSRWGSKYNDYREEIAEILGVENMSEIGFSRCSREQI